MAITTGGQHQPRGEPVDRARPDTGRRLPLPGRLVMLVLAGLLPIVVTTADRQPQRVSPAAPPCTDTDGDGVCDTEEDANTDADGDPATNPGPDTDGDTTPDYLDPDDDGDGTPTASEEPDPSGDGDPRDAVDSDHDGQPDYLDPAAGPTSPSIAAEQKISDTVGGLGATLADGDQFGSAVAGLGDLDGDGVNDLLVGHHKAAGGGSDRGAVHVLFLNGDGTVRAEQAISDTAGGLAATLANDDNFGFSVTGLGDLDGDGIGDAAVGAYHDDDGGTNRGAVYILLLNADGTVKAEQKISDSVGGLSAALYDSEEFGSGVAALGDLDGDGIGDLAVGGRKDEDGGGNRGAVFILFLNGDGTVKAEQKISDTTGGLVTALDNDDFFGSSVAPLGDLDGDGVADLAVGAQKDDDGGTDRGAVYLLFLNTDGTVKAEQKLSASTGGLANVLDDGDEFGRSVAGLGDAYGRGRRELAVGAFGDDDGGTVHGAVHLLSLESDGTIRSRSTISSTAGGLTGPLDDFDRFGVSVGAIGDLDGDGELGLAVGSWNDDDGGDGRGAVYVLDLDPRCGDSDGDGLCDGDEDANTDADGDPATSPGPDTDGDTTPDYLDDDDDGDGTPTADENADPNDDGDPRDAVDGDHDGQADYLDGPIDPSQGTVATEQKISSPSLPTGLDSDGLFGSDVAGLGDLDGDGVNDAAVGIPFDDDGGSNRGAVRILFLNTDGSVRAEQIISSTQGGLSSVVNNGDYFGTAVTSLGDLDGDGINDLAIGAPGDDDDGNQAGAVYVLFLNRNGTVRAEQKISDTFGGLVAPLGAADEFGTAVAGLGDLDGDGIGDLAVGADGDDDGGTNRGAVYVLALNPDGTVKAEQKISALAGGLPTTLANSDSFGGAVASIGDVNGDGTGDVAVGASGDDGGGTDRGALHVLFLREDGTAAGGQLLADGSGLPFSLANGDAFAASVAGLGSFDGSSRTGVLVGAEGDDGSGSDRGAVYLVSLNSDGTVFGAEEIGSTSGGLTGPLDDGDRFGTGVASLGDLDGDGPISIAVGAPDDDDGGSNRGAVYVLDLSPKPVVVTAVDDVVTTSRDVAVVADLIANDSDPNGESITVVDLTDPVDGTVTDNGDGTVTYRPDPAYTGADGFDYWAIDGGSSLIHHWGLGASLEEAVGTADGTATGTTTVAGDFGSARSFDEVDDRITTPDIAYGSGFTISFEFDLSDNSGSLFQYIYSHGSISGTDSINVFFVESGHGTDPDKLRTVLRDGDDSLSNNALEFDISSLVGDGNWHTYTVVADPDSGVTVYLDGVQQATDPTRGTGVVDPAGSLYLGARQDVNGSRMYGGSLDTVQVYDRALAASEVAALAAEQNVGKASVTVDPLTPQTYVVNDTGDGGDADTGDGRCDTGTVNSQGATACTLRAAIDQAEGHGGADTISFALPVTEPGHSSGTWTIAPASGYPLLSQQTTIDGRTQTSYGGTPIVVLDGSALSGNVHGLQLLASSTDSVLRGLSIVGFPSDGIHVVGDRTLIADNYVGVLPDGVTAQANATEGITVNTATGTTIADNLIGGHSAASIVLHGTPTGSVVTGNLIGTDATGTVDLGNGQGLWIDTTGTARIGGPSPADGNVIANSTWDGIEVVNASSQITIMGNEIRDNGLLGIDLVGGTEDGFSVTDNDGGDGDSGPNDLLNYPVITDIGESGGTIDVDFTIDIPAGDYRVEFFTNSSGIDPSGHGEGRDLVHVYPISSHPGGSAAHSTSFGGAAGDRVTATTTVDGGGGTYGATSEFSAGAFVGPVSLTVNSTGDGGDGQPGDGSCDTGGLNSQGATECTLRAAIDEANAVLGADTIAFAIPTSDSGYTASPLSYTITPASVLPEISGPVDLDGTTQPDYAGDPVIELDGTAATGATAGLLVTASDSTIRGFAVHSFADEGLEVDGTGGGGDRNTLAGNWVGITAGQVPAPNSDHGILVTDGAADTTIGGPAAGDGNVIVSNTNSGIVVRDVGNDRTVIDGNLIGVMPDGTTAGGNGGHGVWVYSSATGSVIGGSAPNTIANNGGDGVFVDGSAGADHAIVGNEIHSNGGLGIDRGSDGVTGDDWPDADGITNRPGPVAATEVAGLITLDFDLATAAGTYRIDVYANAGGTDPSGYGEGESPRSWVEIVHGGSGTESFSHVVAGAGAEVLTLTATPVSGSDLDDTSEFSTPITVVAGSAATAPDHSIRRSNLLAAGGLDISGPAPSGPGGVALDLGGGSERLVGPGLDLVDGALTMSASVRLDTLGGSDSILAKLDGSGNPIYELGIDGPSGQATATIRAGGAGTTVTGGSISTGTWHQLAAVWDGTDLALFVDGAEVARSAAAGVLAVDPSTVVAIGNRTTADRGLDGLIDDVRLDHTAWSATRVAAHRQAAATPSAALTIGAQQTSNPAPWTVSTSQSRSGIRSLAAPETAGSGVAAWAVATAVDEVGVVFESWWHLSTDTALDVSAGTRAGVVPTDQYEAALTSPSGWLLRQRIGTNESTDAPAAGTPTLGSWTKVELWTDQQGDSRLLIDGVEVTGWTGQGSNLTTGSVGLRAGALPVGQTWYIDDPRARRLITPEPTTTLGSLDRN